MDWRNVGEGRWAMCLSGASDPVLVRMVGFIVRVHTLPTQAGEPLIQITLRSAVTNGWNLSKAILDKCSNNSTRTYRRHLLSEANKTMLVRSFGLDGIYVSAKEDCDVRKVSHRIVCSTITLRNVESACVCGSGDRLHNSDGRHFRRWVPTQERYR